MTNTETRTNQEIRRDWIAEITDAYQLNPSPLMARAFLALVRAEGPSLADPTNQWWPRRFRWIDLKLASGHDERWVLLTALWDMQFANEHNGR